MQETKESREDLTALANELAQSYEDLHLYAKIATKIKTLQFSQTHLESLVKDILETMRTDLAFATIENNRRSKVLSCKEDMGTKIPDIDSFTNSLLNAISGRYTSAENGHIIVNNSAEIQQFRTLHADPYRLLSVRIQNKERFIGYLVLVSFDVKKIFRRSELRLLTSLAEQVASVLINMELYGELQRFVISVVKSLVSAIEAKDPYTSGHSERVREYSNLVASRLNLPKEEKNALQWAAILHDIGKIGVPGSILNKLGGLSKNEFSIVASHPAQGHEILKPLKQLSSSLPLILHHHERYDGKGYPQGLAGEKIPLGARIIAVADTFDAITSMRPYRMAKTRKEALTIIGEIAGTQLDPRVVKVFKELILKKFAGEDEGSYCRQADHGKARKDHVADAISQHYPGDQGLLDLSNY
jgi:HD-GYP domain-containing protein (c-di-GMP phosphodiesterase class II)